MNNAQTTGEQLYEELCTAAARSGKSLAAFVGPLFKGASWKIEQMRIARAPTRQTIARVRALIAGEPLPPTRAGRYDRDPRAFGLSRLEAEEMGPPRSLRSINEGRSLEAALERSAAIDRARQLTELAHETRRPGQTLHDRVRELKRELAA